MKVLTQREAQQLIVEFKKALLPARMYLDPGIEGAQNLIALSVELKARGLEENLSNLLAVTNSIYDRLHWVPGFEPAKMKAFKKNTGPAVVENPLKLEEERIKKLRASEAADARKKSDDQFEKDALSLIASFFPVNKRGSLDYNRQTEVQKLLKDYVAKEKAKGTDMKSALEQARKYIAKIYADIERAATGSPVRTDYDRWASQ